MRTILILSLALALSACGQPHVDTSFGSDAWLRAYLENQQRLADEKATYEATLTPQQLMNERLLDISDAIRGQTAATIIGNNF